MDRCCQFNQEGYLHYECSTCHKVWQSMDFHCSRHQLMCEKPIRGRLLDLEAPSTQENVSADNGGECNQVKEISSIRSCCTFHRSGGCLSFSCGEDIAIYDPGCYCSDDHPCA